MISVLIRDGLRRILSSDTGNSRSGQEATGGKGTTTLRPSIPVGHFSLVGLSEIREQLGPKWPQVSMRVHAMAQAVISKRLLPGDVFEQHDEDSYIVLFAQLRQKEAEFKSRAIGREITQRLMGDEFQAVSSIGVACVSLAVEADLGPDLEGTLAAALKAAPSIISTAAEEEPNRGISPASPAPPRDAGASWQDARPEVVASKASQVSTIGRPAASWFYTPIWDLNHSAVIQFRLSPAEEVGQRHTAGLSTLQMMLETDRWAMRRAIGDLVELARRGKRFSIICPVHATSLDHPVGRRELLKTLNAVPTPLRRLLTIEFVLPSSGSITGPLERGIDSLKALGLGVTSRTALGSPALTLFHPSFSSVTAQLATTDGPEVLQIERLEKFAARALNRNLTCGAAGLATTSLILAATAAGFRYLSGPAVQPNVESIRQAIWFDLETLYSRRVSGSQGAQNSR